MTGAVPDGLVVIVVVAWSFSDTARLILLRRATAAAGSSGVTAGNQAAGLFFVFSVVRGVLRATFVISTLVSTMDLGYSLAGASLLCGTSSTLSDIRASGRSAHDDSSDDFGHMG